MKKQLIPRGFRTWWDGKYDGRQSHQPDLRRFEIYMSRRGAGEFIPTASVMYIDQDAGIIEAYKPHPHNGRMYKVRNRVACFQAKGHLVVFDHGREDAVPAVDPSTALTSFVRMRLLHLIRSEDPDPPEAPTFVELCCICAYEIKAVEWLGTGFCSKRCKRWDPRRR